MKIIKKFSPNEKDLKESTTQTKLMKDFPPIYQERNPEVLTKLIADFVKESVIILNDFQMMLLSKSEGRGLLLILAQKPLVLRPRSLRKTRLKHPILATTLLLSPKGKEEKENPLKFILKIGLQKLEKKGPRK